MPVQADNDSLRRLLELQGEDSAISKLNHDMETLPEAQRLAERNAQLQELSADLEIAQKQLDEIAREQDRMEGEIGILGQKIEREEKRLFAGSVSNPKELAALQAEVDSLKRKRSGFEDDLLEVMVQRDSATETRDRITNERESTQSEAEVLTKTVGSLAGDIVGQLDAHGKKRTEIATIIPEDLLALYEQIRAQKGGVGAAALVGGTCQGCHTKLPAVEAERVRNEGGLQRCDNCRRILIVS